MSDPDSDEREWRATLKTLSNKFDAEYQKSQRKKRKLKKQEATSGTADMTTVMTTVMPQTKKEKYNEYQRKWYKQDTLKKKSKHTSPPKILDPEKERKKIYQRNYYLKRESNDHKTKTKVKTLKNTLKVKTSNNI